MEKSGWAKKWEREKKKHSASLFFLMISIPDFEKWQATNDRFLFVESDEPDDNRQFLLF